MLIDKHVAVESGALLKIKLPIRKDAVVRKIIVETDGVPKADGELCGWIVSEQEIGILLDPSTPNIIFDGIRLDGNDAGVIRGFFVYDIEPEEGSFKDSQIHIACYQTTGATVNNRFKIFYD